MTAFGLGMQSADKKNLSVSTMDVASDFIGKVDVALIKVSKNELISEHIQIIWNMLLKVC